MLEPKLYHHAHGPGINVGIATDKSALLLDLQTPERVKEFVAIFERALNTWEPEKVPEWAVEIMDKITGTPTQPPKGGLTLEVPDL